MPLGLTQVIAVEVLIPKFPDHTLLVCTAHNTVHNTVYNTVHIIQYIQYIIQYILSYTLLYSLIRLGRLAARGSAARRLGRLAVGALLPSHANELFCGGTFLTYVLWTS